MTKPNSSDEDDSSSSWGYLHSPSPPARRSLTMTTSVNFRSSFQHRTAALVTAAEEEEASEEMAVAAYLQQSPALRLRSSHRFDVTAGGTTARLHSSLVGHGAPFAPLLGDDDDNETALAPQHAAWTRQARGDEEEDPEKTPLLGVARPPSVAARRSMAEVLACADATQSRSSGMPSLRGSCTCGNCVAVSVWAVAVVKAVLPLYAPKRGTVRVPWQGLTVWSNKFRPGSAGNTP